MHRDERWYNEIWMILSLLGSGWILFQIFDLGSEFLIAMLTVYVAWHLYQLLSFIRWLSSASKVFPEDIHGIWQDIYYQMYLSRKRHRTQLKQALAVVREFRDSTNALPDAYVALAKNGEIVWFNKAAETLLGLRKQQDIGQRMANLLRHPEFLRYEHGLHGSDTIEIPSPVQSSLMLHIRLTPARGEQRLLVASDVTRVHKLEQMRQDFVANVSHELRTPITVLRGYLESLSSAGEETLGRYARPVNNMLTQAERMRVLVDDLLFLSRLDNERNHLQFERVNVIEMIHSLAEDATVLSAGKQHSISVDIQCEDEINAAPQALHSAFANLVSNAVRYSPEGGKVTLRWCRGVQGELRFEVHDSGPGIDAIHLPRLTERFYRVDAGRSREAGGTGLGLAIVKHVLEHHGAYLVIYSDVGKGSCFTCVFPTEQTSR